MPSESVSDVFFRSFNRAVNHAHSQIEDAKAADEVDSVLPNIESLNGMLEESVHALPAYDARRASEAISQLSARRLEKRRVLAPRQPFRFRERYRSGRPPCEKQTEGEAGAELCHPNPSINGVGETLASSTDDSHDSVLHVHNRRDTRPIRLDVSASGRDLDLRNLDACELYVTDAISAMRAKSLTGCTIFVAPFSGSALLTDLRDCTVFIAAHQIRIHASRGCNFWVCSTSPPIIEDCASLTFGALDALPTKAMEQLRACKLEPHAVGDVKVVDFSWLRKDSSSPNWALATGPIHDDALLAIEQAYSTT